MNRIGLFFGTFDPLHNGHVAIANYFISKLDLEELWLVVTPQNPFKIPFENPLKPTWWGLVKSGGCWAMVW